MMVDNTGISPPSAPKPNDQSQSSDNSGTSQEDQEDTKMRNERDDSRESVCDSGGQQTKKDEGSLAEKSPGRTRTKSNQRWMKLRTTVQLSGAITSTNQKSKPPLKREDSFLKRFSTRQIPETQETVDTGDETETMNGSQTQNEVNRRRRKRRKELSKTVVNPDENFYFYWLMTVTVCVLYNLWTLIVRQSFPELQKAASSFWYSGDGFTDVVFVCDIVVQFRTGYLEQGLMVYDSKKLASHYLKSRAFILDVLSLLPLDFLQFNIGVNPILRFPRFLKIYRVYNYYYIVESRTVYPNLWRVVNLIHILLILAHWFGCFYYLLSEAEGFQGDWVYPYRPGDYATLTRKYLGSLYWSTLTLTTIGDLPTPETNAESRNEGSKAMTSSTVPPAIPRRGHKSRLLQFNSNSGYLFTIISYLIGVFIFATIVGQVGNVITNRNANRLEFERLLDGAKTYMRHHKVPGGMKRRVLRWYDYSWSRGRIQGGGDINTALGLLPDKLKTELALHVNLSVLKKVTIFQECQPEFLHDLVLKMKAYIFTPGDLICRKGEVAREMFIIADGILDVISETGRVLTTMKAGDFFGEIGILNLDGLNKRTADVRSVGYSELFSLSREDVLTAMKDYPEAQEILQSLGRKRLMEAKNASKMHKAQAKQAKEHDSSGDSDTAGKRIVEKLRSDVKGLKNALRRSRRGTRTKETFDGPEGSSGKSSSKKHSILRRMSHVQSSDEYETETAQSPIGAGLPLLQRLKLLKEKQDKEKDEKERSKSLVISSTQKEENSEPEVIGSGLPFAQRLKLLKQKEDKEASVAGTSNTSSTVRTQVTGVRFDKSLSKSKTLVSPKGSEDNTKAIEEPKKKELTETVKVSLKDKLKLIHGIQTKEKTPVPVQEPEPSPCSNTTPEINTETSNNVPLNSEAENTVPKLLGSKFEVPKSKDGWKILKKSSITSSKVEKKEGKLVRKVSKKGTYLSKSDTVLEKQKTEEKDEEKRSRSMSPSDSSKPRRTLKQTVEQLMRERRRTKSLGQAPDKEDDDVNFWEYPKDTVFRNPWECKEGMKKYDSISDLSPEYSGLPFVKKLKILNERQKLAELEKELLVRSASLDVPERPPPKRGKQLVRSQSEASTIEVSKVDNGNLRSELEARWRHVMSSSCSDDTQCETDLSAELGNISTSGKNHSNRLNSDSSIASPESNETLERRHLKSILKKLSAEDSTSDEDQTIKKVKCSSTLKKGDNAELKKLMRAPTIEGYAARHKKLTKSVTFDSETLPSPPDPGSPDTKLQPETDENKGKGFSPMSPTAILTLQLSNLSMIPLVGPKKSEKKEAKGNQEVESSTPKVIEKLQEELQKFQKIDKETENALMPYVVQELVEKNFRMLPFTKVHDDEMFGEIKGSLQLIVQSLIEEVQNKFQSQFNSLQVEVKKRDEIILQLQSKIQQLEKDSKQSNNSERSSFEGNFDSSGTDPDLSDVPFLRGDSFETILGLNSPTREPSSAFMSPRGSPAGAENSSKSKETTSDQENDLRSEKDNSPFDYLGNVITYEEMKNNSETEDDLYEVKDKICLLSNTNSTTNPLKRRLRRSLDPNSDEEFELLELSRVSRFDEFRRKRNRTEFKLKRNFSVDESQLQTSSRSQRKSAGDIKATEERKKIENRAKGSLISRVTDFQRSFSCSHDNRDFIALDIDDSSNSSDLDHPHNKDWEVQMLVEELEKKERREAGWSEESEDWTSETDVENLEDMKKLQEEVNTLKQMVCESDLTRLTSSELDMLETIIEAKDQKISQIVKSSSLEEEEDKSNRYKKQTHISSSGSDGKLRKSDQKKKSFLRQKIGQALSFDFHDIDSRHSKSPDFSKHKAFPLRKQKTISGSYQERLWHTSSFLRNRVLEQPDRGKNLPNQSTSVSARSSLPILVSSSLSVEKDSDVRTSLPTLSAKDLRMGYSEGVVSSVSSSEDTYQESDFKQSCDSVFEDVETRDTSDIRNLNYPSTSGLVKLSDAQNSLNSFLKSVGQKVKMAMASDGGTVRNQVPTISKLCDEQSILQESEGGCPEDFVGVAEEPKNLDSEGSFDHNPKTDPPDL